MSDLKQQLREDRALRHAARSIVSQQFARVKEDLSGDRIGEKVADKVGPPVFQSLQGARSSKLLGGIAAGAAAVVGLALAWKPLTQMLENESESEEDTSENNDDA